MTEIEFALGDSSVLVNATCYKCTQAAKTCFSITTDDDDFYDFQKGHC